MIHQHVLKDGRGIHGYDDWVALHAPGHTAHMHALFHPQTRILYAADMFVAQRGQFWSLFPVDIDFAYQHSLRRLRELPVKVVLLAHGGIIVLDDVAGGWHQLLDDVEHHFARGFSNIWIWGIRKFLMGYNNARFRALTREMLPPSKLPPEMFRFGENTDDAPPIIHFK